MARAAEQVLIEEAPVDSGTRISVVRRKMSALCASADPKFPLAVRGAAKPLRPRNSKSALRMAAGSGHDLRCALIHRDFHEGRGLELAKDLRRERPLLPVLLHAPKADRNVLSLAYTHDIRLVVGKCSESIIRGFVQEAVSRARVTLDELELHLGELGESCGLTPTEQKIATASVRGLSRSELLSTFDISVNTLKSQTRSILKKTGYTSLNDLSRVVLTGLVTAA